MLIRLFDLAEFGCILLVREEVWVPSHMLRCRQQVFYNLKELLVVLLTIFRIVLVVQSFYDLR